MKRLRVERWAGQLLSSSAPARPCCLRAQRIQRSIGSRRFQSTSAVEGIIYEDPEPFHSVPRTTSELPSPPPEAVLASAKLASLHARLGLPKSLPLQTLSRTLIDPSADPSIDFNNASLAQVGSSLLSYHVSKHLLCTYPRLPMLVLYSAMSAYGGVPTLMKIAREWGVDAAAAPGSEVDPGFLQFAKLRPGESLPQGTSIRPDPYEHYRRGISSRVVYDDEFGDKTSRDAARRAVATDAAYAGFVRAVIGAIYVHTGRDAAKAFIKGHILSRHLDISKLFEFHAPTRDLTRLCAREDFEHPVARLLAETGRASRHPVFVVGIFSGNEKLGEGTGASLDEGRDRAAIAALKAWYLYSPSTQSRVKYPSDIESADGKQKEWRAVHIDIGEII